MPVDVGSSQRIATVGNFFSVAVENPAVFHAFMAKTRCDYDAYLGKVSHAKLSPQVLYHRGQALQSLTKQLQAGKVEYGCVTAIILLMTIDVRSVAAISFIFQKSTNSIAANHSTDQ
jgi:hypothetical protein